MNEINFSATKSENPRNYDGKIRMTALPNRESNFHCNFSGREQIWESHRHTIGFLFAHITTYLFTIQICDIFLPTWLHIGMNASRAYHQFKLITPISICHISFTMHFVPLAPAAMSPKCTYCTTFLFYQVKSHAQRWKMMCICYIWVSSRWPETGPTTTCPWFTR